MRKRKPGAVTSVRTALRVLQWARCQPDAPALSDDNQALSYSQLDEAVGETVRMLESFDVGAADRILVVGENSVALAVLLLASSKLGVCAVLENARRVPAEIAGIVSHCAPRRMFFVHADSPDAVRHATAFGAQRHFTPALGAFSVATPKAPGAVPPGDSELRGAACEEVAIIIYTTGTTGQPKGVMLTHRNLSYIAAMMGELRNMTPQDRVYGVLPITHVMGHASVFLGALHAGASLRLVARFSPGRCIEVFRRHRITAVQGAPAMFAKIAEYCKAEGIAGFEHVRFIGSGGAPIDPTIKSATEALFNRTLHNGYGLTEAASICWTRFEDENRDDSVGRPLPGVELSIRHADGQEVARGEIGELWARGPNLMRGYFRDSELTRRLIDLEGWFNTQDLARIGADGRVFIAGRTKDVIIRSGFKVYPLEVEAALNTHPGVLHVAVVGRVARGNEEVIAYVELVKGAAVTVKRLAEYAAQLLSPYKRPAEIVILPALPLAANGKVLKKQLLQTVHADSLMKGSQ